MKQLSLSRDILKQLIPVAVVATVAAVPLVSPAIAAKGGRPADPSCSVSPDPAAVGQSFTVSAMGLPTTDPVYLIVQSPSGNSTVSALSWLGSGGSWNGPQAGNEAGVWTYTFSGLMQNRKYGAVAVCTEQVN